MIDPTKLNETELKGIVLDQKESIKLIKMTKCYSWEVKILGETIGADHLKRLEEIDKKLRETYGGLE